MRLGIHQPQYMPWIGYLDKINSCDKFVFLDDVQYKKREFQNRNRIKTPQGSMWLTVPVKVKGRYYQNINEVMINNDTNWRKDHIKSIKHNYSSCRYFDKYYPKIKTIMMKGWDKLYLLNMEVIKFFMDAFEIKTPFVMSSDLNIETQRTRRLIDICKDQGADEYISGTGAKNYMVESLFKDAGIKLTYQNFEHPEYSQNFEGFISHLSALDYLFNCGPELFN
ncbi:MAG: WbqC family protein [Elusimicrobiota bacterium]